MTTVKKSTMKFRKRHRSGSSKINHKCILGVINVVFVVCFICYQIILSKSNGGKEAVVSTYRTFLKGGSPPRDSAAIVHKAKDENDDSIRSISEEQLAEFPQVTVTQRRSPSEEKKVKPQSEFMGEDREASVAAQVAIDLSENNYAFDPDHILFHNYFGGKSGKVVKEMMMAHAYIFHQNATYGGCCGNRAYKMTAHEDLLDALGLKDVLRFRCPRDFVHDTKTRRSVIPRDRYMSEDTHIWTPDYVDYLRTLVTYPERRHKEYTIVVHMLRGNTSPCKEKSQGFHSYLPNLHYQNLIDKYMKPGARVIIYTAAKSFESLNEFRDRGYEINTGTSLKDMWEEFVTADVFIMSRSDFSIVPAMVANGMVVYTPFWHHSLREWKRVGKSIMKQTDEETERLQKTECEN